MKPATEILLSAALALTPEEHWTRRTQARSALGHSVDFDSVAACRWCLVGAIAAAHLDGGYRREARSVAFMHLQGVIGGSLGNFNDYRTHAEVLDALYRAAERSEAA